MPRKRKRPWQRAEGNGWYTTVGRKVRKLGIAYTPWDEVERVYHALHANGEAPARLKVSRVCDDLLDICERQRSKGTCDWYAYYPQWSQKLQQLPDTKEHSTPTEIGCYRVGIK